MFLDGTWIEKNRLMIGPWPNFTGHEIPSLEPIRVLINLTETPYNVGKIDPSIIETIHVPIPDFSVPSTLQFRTLVRHLAFYRLCNIPTYMHCMGGFGRAGTMAACYLIMQGETAKKSIQQVRSLRPGTIETKEQEVFIYSAEEWIPVLLHQEDQTFFSAKKLIEVLRQKCPWDHKQTHKSLIPSLLDEAFEVVEAIRSGKNQELQEELGDLLIQPLIHAQIEENNGEFTIYDSLQSMIKKLIYRHPHVFSSVNTLNPNQVIDQWTTIKQTEKAETVLKKESSTDIFEEVRSISHEASHYGFDWDCAEDIVEKMVEECKEITEAIQSDHSRKVEQELGDLLFAALNFARYYGVDPYKSLQRGRRKFEIRFRYVQRCIQQDGVDPSMLNAKQLDEYWKKAKEELPEAY